MYIYFNVIIEREARLRLNSFVSLELFFPLVRWTITRRFIAIRCSARRARRALVWVTRFGHGQAGSSNLRGDIASIAPFICETRRMERRARAGSHGRWKYGAAAARSARAPPFQQRGEESTREPPGPRAFVRRKLCARDSWKYSRA